MYFTCKDCIYTFEAGVKLERCPDCGMIAVRDATDIEIEQYKQYRREFGQEEETDTDEHKDRKKIDHIINVILEAGYNPYEQLYAYLQTGLETYVTREGNARALVADLDREQLLSYIVPYIKF